MRTGALFFSSRASATDYHREKIALPNFFGSGNNGAAVVNATELIRAVNGVAKKCPCADARNRLRTSDGGLGSGENQKMALRYQGRKAVVPHGKKNVTLLSGFSAAAAAR